MSEEKREMRDYIYRLYRIYLKESEFYYQNKEKTLEMEQETIPDVSQMFQNIVTLPICKSNRDVIYRKYTELKAIPSEDEEYYKLKTWLQWVLKLPHEHVRRFPNIEGAELTPFLTTVRTRLDNILYGMDKVKQQVMLFLHTKMRYPEARGCNLALVGEPGVGKTTIARSLADILGFPFQQISLGGVSHADFLKGYDFTYVGSKPGEIVRCMTRLGCKNGILFFDEFDKVSQNHEVVSTLLHITDFSQNHAFRDNYLSEITIDLSMLWFIYSMNEVPENDALRDRLFLIEVEGYTEKDKIEILHDYVLPKTLANIGRSRKDIVFDSDTVSGFLERAGSKDKGVRGLERTIKDLVHRIDFHIHHYPAIGKASTFHSLGKLEYPVVLTKDLLDIFFTSARPTRKSEHLSMFL
jgi:ATP-dependent Lon protease